MILQNVNCNTVQKITDATVSWQCLQEDEGPCGLLHCASLDEIIYTSLNPLSARGAVLRMPACACGASTDLNIGFTLKELCRLIHNVVDGHDVLRGFVLPFRYTHNLRLHSILYARGSVPHPTILPVPPQQLLEHPAIITFPSVDLFYSLWYAYGVMYQRKQLFLPFTEYFQHFTKMPLTLLAGETLAISPPLDRST